MLSPGDLFLIIVVVVSESFSVFPHSFSSVQLLNVGKHQSLVQKPPHHSFVWTSFLNCFQENDKYGQPVPEVVFLF